MNKLFFSPRPEEEETDSIKMFFSNNSTHLTQLEPLPTQINFESFLKPMANIKEEKINIFSEVNSVISFEERDQYPRLMQFEAKDILTKPSHDDHLNNYPLLECF